MKTCLKPWCKTSSFDRNGITGLFCCSLMWRFPFKHQINSRVQGTHGEVTWLIMGQKVRLARLVGWFVFTEFSESPKPLWFRNVQNIILPRFPHFTKFLFWDILHYLLLSDDRSQAQPATGCLLLD